MANKKNPAADNANVTRIKAADTSAPKKTKETKTKEVAEKAPAKVVKAKKARKGIGIIFVPFRAIGSYFKGAWVELRLVRWPTRRATWGMTGAVLAYSAFFVVLVLLLDAGFKYLFELILKK